MIDPKYLDAIKRFEGFTQRAKWDYAQSTNGYGTAAKFDGEVIDKDEAERRFKAEISKAFEIVDRFAPDLDDGSKAALTSLTFNAGTAWTKSGLGLAIQSGDIDAAREIFERYNKAGGQTLPGLAVRRAAEVAWFGQDGQDQPNIQSARAAWQPSTQNPALPVTANAAVAGTFTSIANEIADLPAVQTPASAYSDLAGSTFMEETGGSSTARPEPAFGFSVANLLAFLAIAPWKQNVDETTEDKPGNGRETPLSSIHV